MNIRFLLLLGLAVCLIVELDAAKDRRRKKPTKKDDDEETEDKNQAGFSREEERKDKADRVAGLVERQRERAEEKKEKEESSEEKDDEKSKNGTNTKEIQIPKRMRRNHHGDHDGLHETKPSKEINDGKQIDIKNKPRQQTSRRHRRNHHDGVHETKPAQEINDGKQIEIKNKPKQQTSHRTRRHHGEILEHRGERQTHQTVHETVRTKEINDGKDLPLNQGTSDKSRVGESYEHRRGRKHGKLNPRPKDEKISEESEENQQRFRQRRSLRHKITLSRDEARGLSLVNKDQALQPENRYYRPRA
ncbi:hypothetical protein WR25_03204 [Diploscapter pachys]|uniref:Uncharacterized protein n=1 Tax=Diploscapter pachys TaxID=2018661 RepID=A0A2A2KYP8_9BILA|nr:hypothetical protein WR25_03204 [Diploscapter pachys]